MKEEELKSKKRRRQCARQTAGLTGWLPARACAERGCRVGVMIASAQENKSVLLANRTEDAVRGSLRRSRSGPAGKEPSGETKRVGKEQLICETQNVIINVYVSPNCP